MFLTGLITGIILAVVVIMVVVPQKMFLVNESKEGFAETSEKLVQSVADNKWSLPHQYDLQATMDKNGFKVLPVKVFSICQPQFAHKILSGNEDFVTAFDLQNQLEHYDFSDEQVRHIIPEYLIGNVMNEVLKNNIALNLNSFEKFIYAFGDGYLNHLWGQARGKVEGKNGRYWFQLIGKDLFVELRKRISNQYGNLFSFNKNSNQFVNSFLDIPKYICKKKPRMIKNIISTFIEVMDQVGLMPHLQMIEGTPLIGGEGSMAKYRFYSSKKAKDEVADPFSIMTKNAGNIVWAHTSSRDRSDYRTWKYYNYLVIFIVFSIILLFGGILFRSK